ncbi:hypothetical protein CR513_22304, partial [Mucuna pruriens]
MRLARMRLAKELGAVQKQAVLFAKLTFMRIPREHNRRVQPLDHSRNDKPPNYREDVYCVTYTPTWMDSILDYLHKDVGPNNPQEARKLRKEALKHMDMAYVIKEVHEGVCGTHIGERAIASKIARAGFY